MSGRFEHADIRAGGGYRMILTYDHSADSGKAGDGSDVVEARITEVRPGERISQEIDFESADPAYRGTMTMTWTVAAVDGGSRVEIIAANVPTGISPEDHSVGLTSSLDNLAAFVEREERHP